MVVGSDRLYSALCALRFIPLPSTHPLHFLRSPPSLKDLFPSSPPPPPPNLLFCIHCLTHAQILPAQRETGRIRTSLKNNCLWFSPF